MLPSRCLAALVLAVAAATPGAAQRAPAPVIGRWDMTISSGDGAVPSWLEVYLSGNRTLVGRFVHSGGSARPVAKVEYADGVMRFSLPPQWDRGNRDLSFEGRVDGPDKLSGSMTDAEGNIRTWSANRAPTLRRSAAPAWGKPVALLNGKDLTGWTAGNNSGWKMVGNVLTNTKSGANLVTTAHYTDFKLHAEFRYPKGGNSGIYLRGRYEVQVEDSGGQEQSPIHLGGIYGFIAPNQDASKAAGEWQSVDITLVGRMVTVVLNGKTVVCEQQIPGITGGALDSDEGAPGPIYLQGDHTTVEFRNIVITPAK